MKTLLKSTILAIILTSAGVTANAHEPFRGRGPGFGPGFGPGPGPGNYGVEMDRYGNRFIIPAGPRFAPPPDGRYFRPPIPVPECPRPPVRFEPPLVSTLRFIFGR